MSINRAPDGDTAWRNVMRTILSHGHNVAPRRQPTKEILHTNHCRVDMSRPVVTSLLRKLNYQFMCAEALWILSGSNELGPLTRFVKRMADFSDDGKTLSGAYGPPIADQLSYVVRTLLNDRETRQATLTTWRPRPGPSKDTPCTVAMSFSIREDRLHQHVYMRSSDAWLGIPYDMFSFAMIGLKVACEYNEVLRRSEVTFMLPPPVLPGTLTISATSSHLYEANFADVNAVLASDEGRPVVPVPDVLVTTGEWGRIERSLVAVRENQFSEPWMWQLRLRDGDELLQEELDGEG